MRFLFYLLSAGRAKVKDHGKGWEVFENAGGYLAYAEISELSQHICEKIAIEDDERTVLHSPDCEREEQPPSSRI